MATTGFANDIDCFRQQLWSNRCHFVAMVWMHDEVKCPRIISTRHLAIGNEVIMSWLPTQQSYVSRTTTLAKIDPQVIRQWALSIGAFDGKQQFVYFGQVIGWQTTLDVQMCHKAKAIGVTR
jgi:hypothetical protein